MRDVRPGSLYRQRLGWIAVLAIWALFVAWKWAELRDGALSQERFVMAVSGVTFHVLILIGFRAWEAWKARQPKPTPVYRSTILD